jgi:recombination protein RecR
MMQLPSSLLENAVAEFAKLPGIGKKTALRLVLHLLKQDKGVTTLFGDTLQKMRNEIVRGNNDNEYKEKTIIDILYKF